MERDAYNHGMKTYASKCLVLVCLIYSLAAGAQSTGCLDASDEPHHELLFASADARIFVLDLPRLASTKPYCYAHPYLFVVPGANRTSKTLEGRATMSHDWNAGEARFVYQPMKQVIRNEGMIPHREVVVETTHKVQFDPVDGSYDTDEFTSDLGSTKPTWWVSFTRGGLAASKVRLAPGSDFPISSPNHVLIALTDLELSSVREGKPAEKIELNQQESRILPAGAPGKLTNAGQRPAQFVVVEF